MLDLPVWLSRCRAELGQEAMRRVSLDELFDSIDQAARAKELCELASPGNSTRIATPTTPGGAGMEK